MFLPITREDITANLHPFRSQNPEVEEAYSGSVGIGGERLVIFTFIIARIGPAWSAIMMEATEKIVLSEAGLADRAQAEDAIYRCFQGIDKLVVAKLARRTKLN